MRNLAKSLNFMKLEPAKEHYKEIILRPRRYLESAPHKFMPTIVKAADHWLKLPEEKLASCREIIFNVTDGMFL